MRAFEGQHSDSKPIKRSPDEKRRALAELKQQLAQLKSHAAPTLRSSLQNRIRELEADLGPAPAKAATPAKSTAAAKPAARRP